MHLQGSCHCRRVSFKLESPHPYPFCLCYCSICRKTAGGGGYAINIGGEFSTLEVSGEEYLTVYQVETEDAESGKTVQSPAKRHFCRVCGSALWVWDSRWPDLVHPFASAIDARLPVPLARTHMMLASKAPWVEVHDGPDDRKFDNYPDESLTQWHERHGLTEA